jgi:hypothetical protein
MRFKADIGERSTDLFGLPLTSFTERSGLSACSHGPVGTGPFHRHP